MNSWNNHLLIDLNILFRICSLLFYWDLSHSPRDCFCSEWLTDHIYSKTAREYIIKDAINQLTLWRRNWSFVLLYLRINWVHRDHWVCDSIDRPLALREPKSFIFVSRNFFEVFFEENYDNYCIITNRSCSLLLQWYSLILLYFEQLNRKILRIDLN